MRLSEWRDLGPERTMPRGRAPQTSQRGEQHAARRGRGHVVGCLTGFPRVPTGPFVCPLRRSPLPKEAAGKEGGRGRGRGGKVTAQ